MNTDKIALVERLIKDGAISLADGLMLLETEKETVYVPTQNWWYAPPYTPYYPPFLPCGKLDITCGESHMGGTFTTSNTVVNPNGSVSTTYVASIAN